MLVTAKMRYGSGNESGIYSGADLLMLMRTACPSWLRCTTTLGARWRPTSWTIPSPCSSNAQFHGSRGMQPRPTLTNAMPLKASDNVVPVRPLTKVMPLRRCREPCECDLQGLQMDGLPTTSRVESPACLQGLLVDGQPARDKGFSSSCCREPCCGSGSRPGFVAASGMRGGPAAPVCSFAVVLLCVAYWRCNPIEGNTAEGSTVAVLLRVAYRRCNPIEGSTAGPIEASFIALDCVALLR